MGHDGLFTVNKFTVSKWQRLQTVPDHVIHCICMTWFIKVLLIPVAPLMLYILTHIAFCSQLTGLF